MFAAFDLREIYKDLCIFVIVLSLLFFVLRLLNTRAHEQIIVDAKHPKCDENCKAALTSDQRKQIVGLNLKLAVLSLVLTLALIFSLQYGKKREAQQPLSGNQTKSRAMRRFS